MRPNFVTPVTAWSPLQWIVCAALLLAALPGKAQEVSLDGQWQMRIFDTDKHRKAEAVLQFSDQAAPACMRGKWKRVIVEKQDGADAAFFPLGEALAYKLDRGVLTMGRVAHCGHYLLLSATAAAQDIHGTYKAVSVGRSKQLGLFTLRTPPVTQ